MIMEGVLGRGWRVGRWVVVVGGWDEGGGAPPPHPPANPGANHLVGNSAWGGEAERIFTNNILC